MFAVLIFTKSKKKLRRFFTSPEISSQRIELSSGDCFFLVRAEKRGDKLPLKKLESALGILRKNVLLPRGISLPPESGIMLCSSDILPRLMLMNSAVAYLKERRLESLAVFDERGLYPSYMKSLAALVREVAVVTQHKEKYEAEARSLMKSCGVSLKVTQKPLYDCEAVISFSCLVPSEFEGIVFSCERPMGLSCRIISGNDILLPREYESLRPAEIERVPFASALYEKAGVTDLGSLKFTDFY